MADSGWKDIPGLPGYKANAAGQIGRMFQRCGTKGRPGQTWTRTYDAPRPMAISRNPVTGYWRTTILGHHYYVHRLVAAAFYGAPPDGAHAAHIDGDKGNNSASNLMWASSAENNAHKRRHGTHIEGSRHPGARMTEATVSEVRRRLRAGEARHVIARDLGVNYMRVYKISRGWIWKHVA